DYYCLIWHDNAWLF
nr:immunoglobulin light chain junction region [Macaca mulatta]MOX83173.1 immunoglobulin light chain junction region [Macaca mulatta]